MDGQMLLAKVVEVYDADTITIVFRAGYKQDGTPEVRKYKLRLFGIDAPELHPKKDGKWTQLEKEASLAMRSMLCLMLQLSYNLVVIKFTKEEKFGRLMGTVWCYDPATPYYLGKDAVSLNELLVSRYGCRVYKGDKKQPWKKRELVDIIRRCVDKSFVRY
jgi:endonuclease YncB( thermonuclease family)